MDATAPIVKRTGIEVGAFCAILIFMLTLSFQAGIQYGETVNLKLVTAGNRAAITSLETHEAAAEDRASATQLATTERMARVEQIVTDIRDQMSVPSRQARITK